MQPTLWSRSEHANPAGKSRKPQVRPGFTDIHSAEVDLAPPGNRIHEMGSARMGRDPTTSVLNGWCQAHDVANLFATDRSFMASSACQNPSLTYMAFTARAANDAADLMAEGVLQEGTACRRRRHSTRVGEGSATD